MDRPAAPFPRTSGSACQFPSAWTAGASEWCRHSRPSTGALPHRDGSGSGPVCPCFCCLGTRVSCESWKVPFQGCQPPAILTGQGDPRHPHPQLCDGPSTGRRLAQTLIPALSCVRSVCGSAPPAACPPASTGSRGSRRCSSRGAGVGGCEPPPRAQRCASCLASRLLCPRWGAREGSATCCGQGPLPVSSLELDRVTWESSA